MIVAYLVNQYPKVSHSFIRREIAALEACGVQVERFSIRPCPDRLVDEADLAELARTRVILAVGLVKLLGALGRGALARPRDFLRALALAVKMGWRSDRGLARHLAYLAEAVVLRDWLAAAGATHVHAHFASNPAAVAMLCHALGGPPYSFTVHGPDDYDRALFLSLDQKIARARAVVAVSDYGRSQLYRWCDPRQWPKIRLIRSGIDATFLAAPPTPLPSAPRLVCVGRLSPEKGQAFLLDAVAQVIAEGAPCELTLVGDGPSRPALEAQIKRLKLEGAVEMTGWVSGAEVRRRMLAARLVVLPSLAENLPMVFMEALALGRPVISTYIGGIPELVEPRVCGWLTPAGSSEALVAALREALHTPIDRLAEMGREGARRVAQRHDARQVARALIDLFQSAPMP